MSENIKALIRSCVEKHKYKPLAPGESEYVRAKYKAELPGFLTDKINGSDMKLFMKASNGCGDLVCNVLYLSIVRERFQRDRHSGLLLSLRSSVGLG